MKKTIQFLSFLFISLLLTSGLSSQCPYVASNSFSVSQEDHGNGTCTWTITFDIIVDIGDKNSFAYGLEAEDLGNGTTNIVNSNNDCAYSGILPTTGITVTDTYNGSCDVIFTMTWKAYLELDCEGPTCGNGSETSLIPTPVELSDFYAKPIRSMVELSWTTSSEENNSHFEIQRSEDGRVFENIGMTEGQGTVETSSEYFFIDKYALPFAYYRLKQVDWDGKFEFSKIINVKRRDFQSKLMAYPTQAFNEVTLRLETLDSRKSYLKIVNPSGQLIYDETYYSTADTEYLNLDVQNYPPGIYFVSLSNKTETVTAKFVVVEE